MAVYFVNIYLPDERVRVLLSVKELDKLADGSSNIFRKSNFEYDIERLSATFCNNKFSVLSYFCYVELLAYYPLENKQIKTCEYQHFSMGVLL